MLLFAIVDFIVFEQICLAIYLMVIPFGAQSTRTRINPISINQPVCFIVNQNEHLQHSNKQCTNISWHIQLHTIGKPTRDHGPAGYEHLPLGQTLDIPPIEILSSIKFNIDGKLHYISNKN